MLKSRNGIRGLELDSFGRGQSAVTESCEYSNEIMDSIKGEECPNQHSETQSFKKNSTPLKSDVLHNYQFKIMSCTMGTGTLSRE
jgi:hypothetical protein